MNRERVIEFVQSGNFEKVNNYFEKIKEKIKIGQLDKYGREGVEALKQATPKRTGLTSESWYYKIERKQNGDVAIVWCNSNVVKDYANVAILLQYGHATGNGGYVEGIDYINPALAPVFERIAKSAAEVLNNE